MRFLKALLALTMVAGPLAATTSGGIQERDIQAVKGFLKTKRERRLSDKHDELGIAADVRFEYQHKNEKIDGVKQRGNAKTGTVAKGEDEFDVEVNIYFDYQGDTTFGTVKLEFDNDAGISHTCPPNYKCGSGQCDSICLEIAMFGWHLWEQDDMRLDVKMGRNNLYAILDSRVQYQARFDGVLLEYHNTFEDIGKFYTKAGLFVVDSLATNWTYFVEVGLMDIASTGLDLKYSFIDWTKSQDRSGHGIFLPGTKTPNPDGVCALSWNFRNSQFSMAYNMKPEWLDHKVKLYGALVVNHAAKRETTPHGRKENLAFYVGGTVGSAKGEGEWSVDSNYQYVEAQSVAEFEATGIGRGNVGKRCYATSAYAGNTNYHGVLVEGLYCFTDYVKVDLEAEFSWELDRAAGNDEKVCFSKYEIEFIYSF